jgi:hypothetical protein
VVTAQVPLDRFADERKFTRTLSFTNRGDLRVSFIGGPVKARNVESWMKRKTRATMEIPQSDAHSFIIRVWVEERAEEGGRGVWRGHITHVPSHERRYLKHLDEIGDFIAPYLEAMGIKLGGRWRMRRWLRRLLSTRLSP